MGIETRSDALTRHARLLTRNALPRLLGGLALGLLVAACGKGSPLGPTPPEAEAAGRTRVAVSLRISPSQPSLRPGDRLKFEVLLWDQNGNALTESDIGGKVKWEATGGTISSSGLYAAGSNVGTYRVKATTVGSSGGLVDSTAVQITSSAPSAPRVATSISVSPASASVLTGDTVRFSAVVRDQNGNAMTALISWSATGGTIGGGVYVAGPVTGSFMVTASSGTLSAPANVTISVDPDPEPDDPPVDDPTPVATSISISPTSATAMVGDTVRFSAQVRDQSGSPMTAAIGWSATGGTIGNSGVYVAGSSAGSFGATASSGSLSASATVTISTPSSSLSGVAIYPGQSIQSAVDAKPTGTTFVIKAGRHLRQSVRPKSGMTFVGESGAILDGGGTTAYAFDGSGTPSNVTIRGLVIENYNPGFQQGAIRGGNHSQWFTVGWVVENCEVRYTRGGMGIRTGHRMVARNNNLHHNDQYGIGGTGDDILVVDNVIAYNNYRDIGTSDYGGTKFVSTDRLIVRDNFVHHNHGPGLWLDIDNVNVLIDGNRVEDNYLQGIFHEIGHAAVIRDNIVRRNGFGRRSNWLYDAGILIAHSDNVEVYGNTVEDNWNGIVGIQQDRDAHQLRNLWVHDNTVRMPQGGTGVGKSGSNAYNPFQANNRFDRNDYGVSQDLDKPFRWSGSATWSGWRAAGQDASGSYQQM